MEKYKVDNDIHVHSYLSPCSADSEQNVRNILKYGEENDYKYLCITDHCWSEHIPCKISWYDAQNIAHISKSLPLPQGRKTRFYFGAETDLDDECNLGLSVADFDKFDFVIIPTTHLHMYPFVSVEKSIEAYISRLDSVLDMDLPFRKIGIAHLACHLIAPDGKWKDVLNGVSDEEFARLFGKIKKCGAGVEINGSDFDFEKLNRDEIESTLRVFKIAKKCGCKFYLGSDAHHPDGLRSARKIFENAVDVLDLCESDKFNPFCE